MDVEELKVIVTADATRFTQQIKQIKTALEQMKTNVDTNINFDNTKSSLLGLSSAVNTSLGSVTGMAATTGATIGTATAAGFSTMTVNSANTTKNISNDFKKMSDIAAEGVSRAANAMLNEFGRSTDKINNAVDNLMQRFGQLEEIGNKVATNGVPEGFTPVGEFTESTSAINNFWDDLSADRNELSNVAEQTQKTGQAISQVGDNAEKAGSKVSNFGKNLKTALASFGIVYSVQKVLSFFKDCIEAASDLEEVQNVVDTTFGRMSNSINTFADDAMNSFGLSELAAKQFAGTLGSMFKSMGMTTEESAKMSMNLTALAGDLASFYNLSAEDAFTKIRSGISGETEPLRQLGINLSVANLEAYRLKEGIKTSYDEMDARSQSILRYNYLLEQTASQQGDFTKTQQGFANSLRISQMNWEQLMASIGKSLKAIARPFVVAFGGIAQVLGNVFEKFNSFLGLNTEDTSVDTVDTMTEDISTNLDEADTTAKSLRKTLMGFDEINLLDSGSSSLGGIDGSIANEVIEIKDNYDVLNDYIEESNGIYGSIKLNMSDIQSIAKKIVGEGNLKRMAEFTQEMDKLDELAQNISDAKQELDKYNWMIRMGFTVDKSDYKKTVDNYIQSCNDYVVQQKKTVKLAINFLYDGDTSAFYGKNGGFNYDAFYNGIEDQLAELGNKVKDKVNEAWEDGIITIDEQKEIANLMNQQQKIVNGLATAQQKAAIEVFKKDYNGKLISKESLQELNAEVKKMTDEAYKTSKEAYETMLTPLYYQLDNGLISQTEFNKKFKKATEAYSKKNAEIADNYATLITDVIAQMKSTIGYIGKEVGTRFDNIINIWDANGKGGKYLDEVISQMKQSIEYVIKNMTEKEKESIAAMIEALEPQAEQWEKLAKEYADHGEKIPKALAEKIGSFQYLKAISGNVDDMYTYIGSYLNSSSKGKKMLEEAKKQGIKINEKIKEGQLGKTSSSILKSGVDGVLKTIANNLSTTTILKDLWNSGVMLGGNIMAGMQNGVDKKKTSFLESIKGVANGAVTMAKGLLGIHSPSKVFEEIGEYTMAGFTNGIDGYSTKVNDTMAAWASDITSYGVDVAIASPSVTSASLSVPQAKTTTTDRPVEITLQVGQTKLGKVVVDSLNALQKQQGALPLTI